MFWVCFFSTVLLLSQRVPFADPPREYSRQAFGIDVSQKDTIAEVDIPTHDLSEIFKAGLTSLQVRIST